MKGNQCTVAETAKKLGVTDETVRRYIRAGKLKAEMKKTIGIKRAWFVSADEIRRFRDS